MSLAGQERVGSIIGSVMDPSGAAVPGATVEATSPSLIAPQTTSSNAAGEYIFASLPPGTYTVNVTATGFTTFQQANINLSVGRTLRVNAQMEVGNVSETVVVTADALALDTSSSSVNTNVDSQVYDILPKGRSFDTLIALAPGVRNEPKSGGYSVDGASSSENSYVVDGMEVTNIQDGELNRQFRLPVEWIAETQVKSSGVDAQFGGAIGGVVNAITRSGSNEFHGQVSLYFENNAMDAGLRNLLRLSPLDDEVAEYFGQKKDDRNFLNPGFRLGGPIMRNKLWFFASAYPQFETTNRTVNFLNSGNTDSFERKDRQDFSIARLDYAPIDRLRMNFSYLYLPYRVNGLLPSRQGTDPESNPWADRGYRRPASAYNGQIDFTATNNFTVSAFGGYNYQNYKDYGIPRGTRYRYSTPNVGMEGVPENLQFPTSNITPDNTQTTQDIFKRYNLNVVGNLLLGSHNLKFGTQLTQLFNSPVADTWPDGYIQFYWDRSYNAITKDGQFRGTYGYYRNISYLTSGEASSNNIGLFFQDNWRVLPNLTLNLGIRTEREYVPSFRTDSGISSRAIEFGFGQKLAPRLGFSWDPTGKGRMKIFGDWGMYYDIMKYELPRGSFGGDQWVDYYYTLDDPNIYAIQPNPSPNSGTGSFTGTLIESLDRRIPSNDPEDSLIDPDLKPVRLQSWDLGTEMNLSSDYVAGVRYSHKQLDRTIEDVGILTPQGEQYYITNPGFGLSIDPSRFPAGYPATPKAKREYDAVEFSLRKSFTGNFWLFTSYTWSRLYGNYAGLASSDEATVNTDGTVDGRQSPNVNRNFDEAWMVYDQRGELVYGRLATDRPHTFKFFGSYDQKWLGGSTRLSPQFFAFSGTPITTELEVQDVPLFINGRGDQGRTPVFTQTDMAVMHDFRFPFNSEQQKFRIELNVVNLFNQATAIDQFKSLHHANDGGITFPDTVDIFQGFNANQLMIDEGIRRDPRYGLASAFQRGRQLRFGFHFFF